MRKIPFDEEDKVRERKGKNDKSTWKDYGMLFVLPFNKTFENEAAAVQSFWNQLRAFLLCKNFRKLITDLMIDRMRGDKLAKALKEESADYWKVIKNIEPTYINATSMDEVICNDSIKLLINMIDEELTIESAEDIDDELKQFYFRSGEFPGDFTNFFAE